MKTLNTHIILAEAIRLITRHVPEGEISDKVLDGLVELKRTLPPRTQVPVEAPPHFQAAPLNPHPDLETAVESWIKKNGNPRLEPELRALADEIGDVEL